MERKLTDEERRELAIVSLAYELQDEFRFPAIVIRSWYNVSVAVAELKKTVAAEGVEVENVQVERSWTWS